MNFCNFVKVIIARSTKDSVAIDFYNKNEKPKKGSEQSFIAKYSPSMSITQRFENYNIFMHKYRKLSISTYLQFKQRCLRIQAYITNSSNYFNNSHNGERAKFIEHFSLQNWLKLTESEKKEHTLENCKVCNSSHEEFSSLHQSYRYDENDLKNICLKLTNQSTPKQSSEKKRLKEAKENVKDLVRAIEPAFEKKFNTSFKSTIAEALHLSPESVADKNRSIVESVKQTKKQVEDIYKNNDSDLDLLLSSGKSFQQHDQERMKTSFLSKEETQDFITKKQKAIESGKKKVKRAIGKYESYAFDKESYLDEMKTYNSPIINWSRMAKKYNVTCNGKVPKNGGQVMACFARDNGINVNRFNAHIKLSGRDILQRVRRPKRKIFKSKLSVPLQRSGKHLKNLLKSKIEVGEINVGVKIAPKVVTNIKIDSEGNLVSSTSNIYGRKIKLREIIEKELRRIDKAGVLRKRKDTEYNQMDENQVLERLSNLHVRIPDDNSKPIEELRNKLILHERTLKLKLWHDHSDILNHTYISFMVSLLYDEANFLSNEEFKNQEPVYFQDTQTVVERPNLYMLGQSASTDKEQATYISTRCEDLEDLKSGIVFESLEFQVELRLFSGDNPARQFEAGQQRGGNYTCICGMPSKSHMNFQQALQQKGKSLEERRKHIVEGEAWKKINDGNLQPFQKMTKQEIEDELEARGIATNPRMKKDEMQQKLQEHMKGIVRPPALSLLNPDESMETLNLQHYEVLAVEPLHDISGLVKNLIEELPSHFEDKSVQSDYQKFANETIGDRNQLKGSDARLFAIKLAKFTINKKDEGKVSSDLEQLITTLVEIINISYSGHETRCPRQILRLYNLTFIFSVLCRKIIGNPSKVTSRKFYGIHFHSISTHLAETYRVFNLKAVLTEQEERSFGDLRRISAGTSNRKAEWVVDNAVIRYTAKQNSSTQCSSFHQQDSSIKKQARLLPKQPNTIFTPKFIYENTSLFQIHLQRIADFLEPGEGIWWHFNGKNVVFHDGHDQPRHHEKGPFLSHFRNSSLQNEVENAQNAWVRCVAGFKNNKLHLPVKRVKCFVGDKPIWMTQETNVIVDNAIELEAVEKEHTHDGEQVTANDIIVDDNGIEGRIQEQGGHIYEEQTTVNNGSVDDNGIEGRMQEQGGHIYEEQTTVNDGSVDDNGIEGRMQKQGGHIYEEQTNGTVNNSSVDDNGIEGRMQEQGGNIYEEQTTVNNGSVKRKQENQEAKKKYQSFIKVRRWQSGQHNHECKISFKKIKGKENRNPNKKQKREVKRSLFTRDQEGTSDDDDPFELKRELMKARTSAIMNRENKEDRESESSNDDDDPFDLRKAPTLSESDTQPKEFTEKYPTAMLVEKLLGDCQDVKNFHKYRRLCIEHPMEASFNASYEKCKAVVSFKILGVFNKMKKDRSATALFHQTKQLLERWGINTRY